MRICDICEGRSGVRTAGVRFMLNLDCGDEPAHEALLTAELCTSCVATLRVRVSETTKEFMRLAAVTENQA